MKDLDSLQKYIDELQDVMAQINDPWGYGITSPPPPPPSSTTKDADTTKEPHKIICWHEWKEYFGLNERYEYCVKCDQKKKPE